MEAIETIKWENLLQKLKELTGKTPDVNAILFMIGVQELGKGPIPFTKEQKQDLIHVGTCTVLSSSDYYIFDGRDEDNWPHFKTKENIPFMKLNEQEDFLKKHILEYFKEF